MAQFKIGPAVRSRLGRWEIPAADAYRGAFINLEDCATMLSSMWPASRILEVGCGDGSFAERLLAKFPEATYTGIDIAASPGGLFRGDADRATFESVSSSDFLARSPGVFDLVVVVDVIHHVPPALRQRLLLDVQALTARGGHFAIKDWEPTRTFGHYVAYAADRYITGDNIQHVTPTGMKDMVATWLGDPLYFEAHIPPRRNNYLLGYTRAGSGNSPSTN